jgi:hypothetical protein
MIQFARVVLGDPARVVPGLKIVLDGLTGPRPPGGCA